MNVSGSFFFLPSSEPFFFVFASASLSDDSSPSSLDTDVLSESSSSLGSGRSSSRSRDIWIRRRTTGVLMPGSHSFSKSSLSSWPLRRRRAM